MPTISSSVIVSQTFHSVSADQVGALFNSNCVTLQVFYESRERQEISEAICAICHLTVLILNILME